VFPPSTHEVGEPIAWVEHGAPAKMDSDQLTSAVETLAKAVMDKLEVPKVDAAFSAMMKLTVPDHNDGSRRLLTAACRAVEHDLTDQQAIDAIRAYEREKPFPRDWSDEDILQRVRDAEDKAKRGEAPRRDKSASAVAKRSRRSPPLPWKPFPTNVLPEPIRGYVRAGSHAMKCDEAYIALPLKM